jgi:hypothetical protein
MRNLYHVKNEQLLTHTPLNSTLNNEWQELIVIISHSALEVIVEKIV